MKQKAFTLVELLVVISIIALLLSILMPALNNAREQAKVLTCMANCKQIGTLINVYQAENNGAVPIILNRWCDATKTKDSTTGASAGAKNNYISLGLRDYSPSTKNLPKKFDPAGNWALLEPRMKEYIEKYLPKYYVCPFVRGKAVTAGYVGDGTVRFGTSSQTYYKFKYTGMFESYNTWCWGRQQGEDLSLIGSASPHPLGLPNGRPKFTALPWHCGVDIDPMGRVTDLRTNMVWGSKRHLRPTHSATERTPLTFSSMSEVTVAYCFMGENYDWNNSIFNYGSHRKSKSGGSTAIFADGHVGWVRGTQIGWQ